MDPNPAASELDVEVTASLHSVTEVKPAASHSNNETIATTVPEILV